MQYITIGNIGKDYMVKMTHGAHYMSMKITTPPGGVVIYEDRFLPYSEGVNEKHTKILAEENGQRIAKNYIK